MRGGQDVKPEDTLQFIILITSLVTDSDSNENKIHYCTGNLIAPNWVLTSGHCFPLKTKEIRLQWMLTRTFWGYKYWKCYRKALEFYLLDKQMPGGEFSYNDLALVNIEACDASIAPVKLATKFEKINFKTRINRLKNLKCITAGFGQSFDKDHNTPKLRKIVINEEELFFDCDDKKVCVNFDQEGRGTCKGDSGGPILCNGELYGILSHIQYNYDPWHCGMAGTTSYFEDVRDHYGWINRTMSCRIDSYNGSPVQYLQYNGSNGIMHSSFTLILVVCLLLYMFS